MDGFEVFQLLADEIGEEAARKVFKLFSGGSVNFPKSITILHRDSEIIERFKKGESYETLARSYSLSPQRIRYITSHTHKEEMRWKFSQLEQK